MVTRVRNYKAFVQDPDTREWKFVQVPFSSYHFHGEPGLVYTDSDRERGPNIELAREVIRRWNEGVKVSEEPLHYKLGETYEDNSKVFIVPMFVAVRANNAEAAEAVAAHGMTNVASSIGDQRTVGPYTVDEKLGAIEVEGPDYESLTQLAKVDVYTREPQELTTDEAFMKGYAVNIVKKGDVVDNVRFGGRQVVWTDYSKAQQAVFYLNRHVEDYDFKVQAVSIVGYAAVKGDGIEPKHLDMA